MSSNQPNVPWWMPHPEARGGWAPDTGSQVMNSLTAFWNWLNQTNGNVPRSTSPIGQAADSLFSRSFPPASPFQGQGGMTRGAQLGTNPQQDNESGAQNTFGGAAGSMVSGIANGLRIPPQFGGVPQNVGAGGGQPVSQLSSGNTGQTYPSGGGHGPTLGRAHPTAAPNTPGGQGQGQGAGAPNGMSPDEAKWKGYAEKAGLNWDVVKSVYMNPNRNGTPNVADALERAFKDKAWGDAALAAGILRQGGTPENDAWNNQVWMDHYNAGGNMQYDPMAGHNEAIAAFQANYENNKNALQPPQQYPDWYTPPPQ